MTLQLILSLSLQQMNMSLAMTALRLLTNSAVKLATVLSAAGPGLLTLTGPVQKLHAAALAKKAKNLKKPVIPALKSRLMAKKRLSTSKLFRANLLGGSIKYNVDLSQAGCGCVTAFYTVLMPAVDNTSDPFKYCDANKVGGHWCPEFDIMEANKYAFKAIGHTCDAPDG